MNFYFDLHCHPGTKPYLSGLHLEDKDDCWKVYENPLVKITCSQSAYTQLDNGNVKLAVVPIYVMEKEFTQTFLIEHIAPTLTLLDAKMLGEVQIGDGLDHLFGEIQILENSLSQNADDTPKAQFLTTMDKFDSGKINIVLAIEGAQGFVNGPNSMVENLTMLKNHPKYRFLYLTLIHATRNYCGTHAYAIKMLKGTNKFKPGGEGLTDLGKELIDLAYDEEKGKRILIDIKHMSLVSRLDF